VSGPDLLSPLPRSVDRFATNQTTGLPRRGVPTDVPAGRESPGRRRRRRNRGWEVQAWARPFWNGRVDKHPLYPLPPDTWTMVQHGSSIMDHWSIINCARTSVPFQATPPHYLGDVFATVHDFLAHRIRRQGPPTPNRIAQHNGPDIGIICTRVPKRPSLHWEIHNETRVQMNPLSGPLIYTGIHVAQSIQGSI
jgi:hypothetical protein